MTKQTRIPLAVDIDRVLEVLAAQIYQSPLALLRENLQNAFDAALLRMAMDPSYDPRIDVQLSPVSIVISDNGIGMSESDIKKHFWRAGSSSKNTPEAKAAGVVGTFGIGAMANFGVASTLTVETENSDASSRTWSRASRDTLSATENCIDVEQRTPVGSPGTTITAEMYQTSPINVDEAIQYVKECVGYLRVPVYVNEELVSQNDADLQIPNDPAWSFSDRQQLTPDIHANVRFLGDGNGDVWIEVDDLVMDESSVAGRLLLKTGVSAIRTFRTGFSLAPTTTSSVYQLGGIADLAFLKPTAGREALESQSQQQLQDIVQSIERQMSYAFANHDECDQSTKFLQWVLNNHASNLCDRITVRYEPDDHVRLGSLRGRTVAVYVGHDPNVIRQSASPDAPLVVLAQSNPRRKCQLNFLRQYAQIDQLDDTPRVQRRIEEREYSLAQSSIVFRIGSILESDYFLPSTVAFAEFSHPVPAVVDTSTQPITVFLSSSGSAIQTITQLYSSEFEVFGHMVKDFVRTTIFPKVAGLVPSATREGAEAFLRQLRSKMEVFEYEMEDTTNLSDIWEDVLAGRISVNEGARRSQILARRNVQVVGSPSAATEIIPDLEQVTNETPSDIGTPAPAISRTDIDTDAKLLTIDDDQPAVAGYRCFLALTDRVFEEKGDFFLHPHSTNVIWGGQRALFVFEHHSGEFGLYYDIQAPDVVSPDAGGGPSTTATLFLKNRIFIPIPSAIMRSFIPADNERKRLEVRCDILYTRQRQGSSEDSKTAEPVQ